MGTAVLELREICKSLGHQQVLDKFSLQVESGEFVALLGPSGCGKTTCLRLIAGFDHPTSGEILLNGESVRDSPPYTRDVNMVFQNYALFPHLTLFQNIAFGLEMQQVSAPEIVARVSEALELVRLSGLETRFPSQLSGGQQQRVALARALVTRPSMLLLDEPLGALDLRLRKEMQSELKKLQRRLGIAFLYVTHDQEEALTMSDRMAVMDRGRILQSGPPSEVYERPVTRFVAEFVGETNILTGQASGRKEGLLGIQFDPDTLWVSVPEQLNLDQQPLTVALRPEKILLSSLPVPECENRFPAVVEEATFLGNDMRYLVRLNPQKVLAVRRQDASQDRRLSPGSKVFACFSARNVQVLKEEK